MRHCFLQAGKKWRGSRVHWANISDVALLKRLRKSEEWLRLLCIELFRENCMNWLEEAGCTPMRIVDGTIIKEPGRTGNQ